MIELQDFSSDALHTIGRYINDYVPHRNAFVTTLMDKIVSTIVMYKSWDNPLSIFKRGTMEYGETIEEVFINLARPFDFNPDIAEKTLFRREYPDVRVNFYTRNYHKFYKVTVSDDMLYTAFNSWGKLNSLVMGIIDSLYKAMNYDEYITTKYMLCRNYLNGGITGYKVSDFTSNSNLGDLIASVKGVTNTMRFLSPNYNAAGVYNSTQGEEIYCFVDTMLDARVDVNVLASAFNMDKTEFVGRRVLVHGWDKHDTARLAELFGNDPNYTPFTSDELGVLASIGAMVCSRDAFMIYDTKPFEMRTTENGEGLYRNYVLHTWRLFAMSPFAQIVAFTKDVFSVTDVDITKDGTAITTDTLARGASAQYAAAVDGFGVYNGAVMWSLSGAQESGTYIMGGTLRVATNETASTLTLTATSVADSGISASVTITVS